MSCDNLPGNGHVTQAAVTGLARLSTTRRWRTGSQANVAFPNGMVDRITPATGPRERALAPAFGLDRSRARDLRALPAMGAGGQLSRKAARRWKRSA
jgi:hypothetical protein